MNLKEQTTIKLLAYADMLTQSVESLDMLGRAAAQCEQFKGITLAERDGIHKKLMKPIEELEDARISISKELERRLKKEMDVSMGPNDVQGFIGKFQQQYPMIGKGEAEINMIKSKAEIQKNQKKAGPRLLN